MVRYWVDSGAAYVVENNFTGKSFVAKKMNLDGMSEAEIQAAKGEVFLKNSSDINSREIQRYENVPIHSQI